MVILRPFDDQNARRLRKVYTVWIGDRSPVEEFFRKSKISGRDLAKIHYLVNQVANMPMPMLLRWTNRKFKNLPGSDCWEIKQGQIRIAVTLKYGGLLILLSGHIKKQDGWRSKEKERLAEIARKLQEGYEIDEEA